MSETLNIAHRLAEMARRIPNSVAVAQSTKSYDKNGRRIYKTISFQELDKESDRIAASLIAHGIRPGMKLALLVRQGIDFITLVFAMYKAGAVLILIDPGMGIRSISVISHPI